MSGRALRSTHPEADFDIFGSEPLGVRIRFDNKHQVGHQLHEGRQKALKDLYAGQPPPRGCKNAVERPSTPKWLFRGHNYNGVKTKEERDKRVLDAMASERLATLATSQTEPSESGETQQTKSLPPPGFAGGTMQQWAKHMKELPGGRNWLDR